MKWWMECSPNERDECRVWSQKLKWVNQGYSWGLMTYVDYCRLKEHLEKELDEIERKYDDEPRDYEEQLTLF